MPALNFKPEFAEKIKSGEKRQTIKAIHKREVQIGDTLYLYTGLRTKRATKLKTVVCLAIQKISIYPSYVELDNQRLNSNQIWYLARLDGFGSINRFFEFFRSHYGLPFEGVIIKW